MLECNQLGHLVLTIMILVKGPCHNLIFLCPLQLKRKGKWICEQIMVFSISDPQQINK